MNSQNLITFYNKRNTPRKYRKHNYHPSTVIKHSEWDIPSASRKKPINNKYKSEITPNKIQSSSERKSMIIKTKLPVMLLKRLNELNESFNDLEGKKFTINTKAKLLMEEYKQERLKRTNKLLDDINTNNNKLIEQIYDYRVNSIINLEKNAYNTRRWLYKMLDDHKRIVAKIELQKRARHVINKLKIRNEFDMN